VAEPDLRIASIAVLHGLTLVTGNVRHFAHVPGLTIENWLSEHGPEGRSVWVCQIGEGPPRTCCAHERRPKATPSLPSTARRLLPSPPAAPPAIAHPPAPPPV
jgi:hypothetical protein